MYKLGKYIKYYRQLSPSTRQLHSLIDLSPEVQDALKERKPIVALESTIITHGMPYPFNLETAISVEEIVRNANAIPATIAILNGRIKVGLMYDDLEILARKGKRNNESPMEDGASMQTVNENHLLRASFNRNNEVNPLSCSTARPSDLNVSNSIMHTVKTSRRDLAYVLNKKWNGGTTVAGTLIIANLMGINVFATGGIGGVHRDGHITMDISADLIELGKSNVAVVSSGIKSILDIPKTLEFLETQGVCVATYQVPDFDFPAFYTRRSGSKVTYNFSNAYEAANTIKISNDLGLNSGILIGVPVPIEHTLNETDISEAISNALDRAKVAGITGKEVTPFLLDAISKITIGQSLQTNMSLIKNNAKVAAEIACELAKMKNQSCVSLTENVNTCATNDRDNTKNDSTEQLDRSRPNKKGNIPVVIGGSIVDCCYKVIEDDLKLSGGCYNTNISICAGGVARNLADALNKIHGGAYLISIVGDDQHGLYLKNSIPIPYRNSIETDHSMITSTSAVIMDNKGDCKMMCGAMDIHSSITPNVIIKNEKIISKSPIAIMDANLSIDTMGTLLDMCKKYDVPVFFEPTDLMIAHRPFALPAPLYQQIKFISPNIPELIVIAKSLNYPELTNIDNTDKNQMNLLNELKPIIKFVTDSVDNVIVTLGSLGVLIATNNFEQFEIFHKNEYKHLKKSNRFAIQYRYYQCKKTSNVVNVSGAGDSFISGFISAMLRDLTEDVCVAVGFEAANYALKCKSAVPVEYFTNASPCWRQSATFSRI